MSTNEQNKPQKQKNFFLQCVKLLFLFCFPIHRIPDGLACNKKSIKNKQFLYPLLSIVYVVSLIVTPVCLLISLITGDIISFLYLIIAIPCLVLSIKYLPKARAKLDFFCDDCNKPLDFNYTASSFKSETVHLSKTVVVGSHYNVTSNNDGSYDVRKVVDTEKRSAGSFKVNENHVHATLTCPVCAKKKEYSCKCKTYNNGTVSSKDVKDAIIEQIIHTNSGNNVNLLKIR